MHAAFAEKDRNARIVARLSTAEGHLHAIGRMAASDVLCKEQLASAAAGD